jgi:GNAT superfamily N-acetyltransferase
MASTEAVEIRPIDPGESDAVHPLSVEAGWNQTVADWRFMLGAGRGFGCLGGDGRWQASSLVLPLGETLAWVSMVLVTQSRRREGLGTRLLKRCLEEAAASGRIAGLDATEQGRPIYLPLGFRDLYPISRWQFDGAAQSATPAPRTIRLRPVVAKDLPALALYDRPRSGMDRAAVLKHLSWRQPHRAWIAEDQSATIAGFVLAREGRMATSLGPVVADNEAIAIVLIEKSAGAAAGPFIIDVPQAHRGLRCWLEASGATTARGYMRMILGERRGLGTPSALFAIGGPELG